MESDKPAATVKENLTVQPVSNAYKLDLDEIEQWALDGCPEGVSGMPESVLNLVEVATSLRDAEITKRMSDAVTLLYSHGILTEKMRAHCRARI